MSCSTPGTPGRSPEKVELCHSASGCRKWIAIVRPGYAGFMRNPDIELLWWAGCPSTDKAQAELEQAMRDVGLAGAQVRSTEVATDEEAKDRGFVGSPTILVDGADIAPPDPDEVPGLTCRVYRRRDSRIAPTPDPDDMRDALRRAAFARKQEVR